MKSESLSFMKALLNLKVFSEELTAILSIDGCVTELDNIIGDFINSFLELIGIQEDNPSYPKAFDMLSEISPFDNLESIYNILKKIQNGIINEE